MIDAKDGGDAELQPDAIHSLLLSTLNQLRSHPTELEPRVMDLITKMRHSIAMNYARGTPVNVSALFYSEVMMYLRDTKRIKRDLHVYDQLYHDMLAANMPRVAIDQWPQAWMVNRCRRHTIIIDSVSMTRVECLIAVHVLNISCIGRVAYDTHRATVDEFPS